MPDAAGNGGTGLHRIWPGHGSDATAQHLPQEIPPMKEKIVDAIRVASQYRGSGKFHENRRLAALRGKCIMRSDKERGLAVITFNDVPAINHTFKYDRLGRMALENRRRYCERHGYRFISD